MPITYFTAVESLVLLPIIWSALRQRARVSAAVLGAAIATLAACSGFAHAPVQAIVLRVGLWGLAGTILVLGVHNLRRRLGDALAEREEALRQARVLGDAARELNSTLDPDRVVSIAVRLAAEIASPPGRRPRRANYCRISDGIVRVNAEHDGAGAWLGASWPLTEHRHLARAVRTRTATSGALDGSTLGPTVLGFACEQGVAHGGWVPVVVDGELHGVLAVAGRNRPITERELSSCVAIVGIMELALGNALTHQRTQRAALTDPLTSLANRRALERLLGEPRGRSPFTVLAIDIDQLKEVNDRHGHAAGDALIVEVAGAIGSVMRTGDVLARIGGDEFAAVVFDADDTAGEQIAGRMVQAVLDAPDCALAPRISVGVACGEPGSSLADTLARADAAMYEAKRTGGMRWTVAPPGPVTEPQARRAAA